MEGWILGRKLTRQRRDKHGVIYIPTSTFDFVMEAASSGSFDVGEAVSLMISSWFRKIKASAAAALISIS